MIKYVFIQNDPFLLPKVLDKYLREFSDTTAGVNIQSVAQGKRTVLQTAWDLYQLYGFNYFQWKVRRYIIKKMLAKIQNDILGSTKQCHSVAAVASPLMSTAMNFWLTFVTKEWSSSFRFLEPRCTEKSCVTKLRPES